MTSMVETPSAPEQSETGPATVPALPQTPHVLSEAQMLKARIEEILVGLDATGQTIIRCRLGMDGPVESDSTLKQRLGVSSDTIVMALSAVVRTLHMGPATIVEKLKEKP
ncbi:MAG: hypothetical protein Greene041619_633 [Candidatus Peregrinibacteria bacterium Greene0416_19]|nr:MAG: hypothetical protein Greene041619_633 [Candidatus Peregrinibacteria bacterium Greene0416_19]